MNMKERKNRFIKKDKHDNDDVKKIARITTEENNGCNTTTSIKHSRPSKTTTLSVSFSSSRHLDSLEATSKTGNPTRQGSGSLTSKKQIAKFIFVAFVLVPCFLLSWYAAAIFFTPNASKGQVAKFFLWDEGKLTYTWRNATGENGEENLLVTIPTLCPRPSICSEGIAQLIMIGIARLMAFLSYVFMTFTFVSKMHFLSRFLSSTYLRKYIPFENLHHVHVKLGKVYGGLIFMHALAHYIRYFLRRKTDLLKEQLQSQVHGSGFIGIIAMLALIVSMSPWIRTSLEKKRLLRYLFKFETRFNSHWLAMIVLCITLCFHHQRLRFVTITLL